MILRNDYINKIITYMDTPFIKILTGVRRCGKSTIMNMLRIEIEKRGVEKKRILHYNFDSLEYQTLEGMIEAIGIDPCKVCTYCWNGKE